ncbi:MAG: putative proteasome accessory factor [Actinomycetota bacterium]
MSRRPGPKKASERVDLLLRMLPWLFARRQVSVTEMANEFNLDEDALIGELELACTCGLPPYTPDVLAGFYIDEDRTIHVGGIVRFTRRKNLTPSEVFGLALLGEAGLRLLPRRRRAALKSALAKLPKRLAGDELLEVDLGEHPNLEAVQSAAASGERLEIEYWNPDRDDITTRVITVLSVFSHRGHWYARANDDLRVARRTFRVDRMRSVRPTGEHVDISERTDDGDMPFFTNDTEGERVVLRLLPGADWVLETYPYVSAVPGPDGTTEVTLIARGEHWLGRLLLRAGADATVVSPSKWHDLGRRTADSVLARYSS